ncbi:ATP-binding protein [Nocardioides sp. NPDC087217]|uniref:ATP-binding protein n=1 Tax=Nocardioides sp. NPDC087217 TaxID=3364335 RepID=UPI003818987E
MTRAQAPRRIGNPVGPALTTLVARRHELEDAKRALEQSRMVTLTGLGGVGKTRLALELGFRMRPGFSEGVWLTSLGDLRIDAGVEDIEAAMVQSLGMTDQSARAPRTKLLDFLQDQQVLIVLDNCEHVLAPVRALLPELLNTAPDLRIIATSREPIGVPGEVLLPVQPLSVPSAKTPVDELVMDGSVTLLIERAQAVAPDFQVTEENAAAVIELCGLLEGLPLAIELAAVKLRTLTVEQVVQRFGHRLTRLADPTTGATPRHQSLRALVQWSYELCSKHEQILWRRLSVFPSDFDLELAEGVCAFDSLTADQVMDALERLVGQSILLTHRDAGVMRYRLLTPLREIAAALADQANETTELDRRHRDAMMNRAEATLARWCGPDQPDVLAQMRRDHASYVAALQWCADSEGEGLAGLQLLNLLRYHWLSGGLLAEGRMRIEAMLTKQVEPSAARTECLWLVLWIALLQGDRTSAGSLLAQLEIAAELPGNSRAVHVQHWRGLYALFSGNPAEAVEYFKSAAQGHHQLPDDLYLELTARYMLASALVFSDRPQEALVVSRETVEMCKSCGDRSARVYAMWAMAVAQWRQGNLDEAESTAHEVLRLLVVLRDPICVALTTSLLSWVAFDQRRTRAAGALLVAAGRVWRSLGTSLDAFGPQLLGWADRHVPRSTSSAIEVANVRPLRNLDDVIELGLDLGAVQVTRRDIHGPLTARELEVAALIEAGLSNREIAERLVVSKRTADGHVERILAKLGFTSRRQVAAWISRENAKS